MNNEKKCFGCDFVLSMLKLRGLCSIKTESFVVGALWVCVVLNPQSTWTDKELWHDLLSKWAELDVCPLEDTDTRTNIPGNMH